MDTQIREIRKPVSFRIPRNEMDAIEGYARKHCISKSNALIHFLRKGIDADSDLRAQLNAIQQSIDKVLGHVQESIPLPSVDEISSSFSAIAHEYPAIKSGFLFGSFARGDATSDSDVDLRLVLDEKGDFSLFDLSRIKKDLERTVNRKVDIITARTIADKRMREAIEKGARHGT